MLAALILAAVLGCAALVGSPSLAPAATKAKIIGPTKNPSDPTCPTPKRPNPPSYKFCNAYGHVTGFQIRTDEERAVHKVRQTGHLVAWSMDLGKPREGGEALSFFESELRDETFDRYGSEPVANIAVLKKKKGSRGRFILAKKTPIVQVGSMLGEKPIFTLDKPIRVKKGRILALTTPTWLPNFARATPNGKSALSSKNIWRASRKPDRCEPEDLDGDGTINGSDEFRNLTKRSKPQVRKGSTKRYGCIYNGAQILYWGYFVPQKKKGDGGGKKGN